MKYISIILIAWLSTTTTLYADIVPRHSDPRMVTVPAGTLMMGCLPNRDGKCLAKVLPARQVTVNSFDISQYEVSQYEWSLCARDKGCHTIEVKEGDENNPIANISWQDAQDYIRWLNKKTGKQYRLPSEAEWEYAARGGIDSRYPWGNSISCEHAHYDYIGCKRKAGMKRGMFSKNNYGVFDSSGGVWELVADCWHASYHGAPNTQQAWQKNCIRSDMYVVRGGSYLLKQDKVRTIARKEILGYEREHAVGFRVVRDKW